VLVNEEQGPGNYSVEWSAAEESSGIYFYELRTTHNIETKKMLLLK
jgi:hypothetical protein